MSLDLALVAERMKREGRVLPLVGTIRGIFEPSLSLKLDRTNFDGVTMAPRFADSVRGRPDRCPVLWKEVRSAISEQTRRFGTPESHRALNDAMAATLGEAAGRETDLTWLTERTVSENLLPYIVAGLPPAGQRALVRDQHAKLRNVLTPFEQLLKGPERLIPAIKRFRDARAQVRAARAVSAEIRRRMRGRSPAQDDYTQAVMTLIDRLGVQRATYVVTTLLTAIAGAPGTVAACTLWELVRRDEWRARVRDELAAIPEEAFLREPVRSAPLAHRFVKEAMRMWSFPLLLQRIVSKDFEAGGLAFAKGETYFLSSYILHRDESYWEDPDTFDPDRWLRPGEVTSGAYVPFGWAPRTCPGASFGLAQLMMFLRLATLKFEVEPTSLDRSTVAMDGIAAPKDFLGIVRPA